MSVKKNNNSPIIIAGAGLTGLSAAYHCNQPSLLLEKENYVGGLSASIHKQGFTFDYTGHWLHTRKNWTRHLIIESLGINLVEIKRHAAIYSHNQLTAYPFQAHTFGLPNTVIADCVLGFFKAREKRARGETTTPQSFGEHIRDQLGEGIAKHFMLPYNNKLWTVPPDEMMAHWCKRFVPQPTPEEVVYGALRPEGTGEDIGYNNSFWYPAKGGIGTIAESFDNALEKPARRNDAVTNIDVHNQIITTTNNEQIPYKYFINTMPLTKLIEMIPDVPDKIRNATSLLRSASVSFWIMGFKGSHHDQTPHWIYFPETAFPFYRLGSPSAVQSDLAPFQHRSFWVEVSHRTDSQTNVTNEQILTALEQTSISAPGEQAIFFEKRTIPIAYVIMDKEYEQAKDTVLQWLDKYNIHSTGRYGAWIYNSMEDSIIAGKHAAQWIQEKQS